MFFKRLTQLFLGFLLLFSLVGLSKCDKPSCEDSAASKSCASKNTQDKSSKEKDSKKSKMTKKNGKKKDKPKKDTSKTSKPKKEKKQKKEDKKPVKASKNRYELVGKSSDDEDDDFDDVAFLENLNTKKSAEKVEEEIRELLAKLKEEDQLLSSCEDFDQPYQAVTFGANDVDVDKEQSLMVQATVDDLIKAASAGQKIKVRGHADILEQRSDAEIAALSQKRAESVKAELVKAGVPADSIEIAALGASEPVVFGFSAERQEEENRANRRVEIWAV